MAADKIPKAITFKTNENFASYFHISLTDPDTDDYRMLMFFESEEIIVEFNYKEGIIFDRIPEIFKFSIKYTSPNANWSNVCLFR